MKNRKSKQPQKTAWVYTAKWTGGIEYEKATIENPLRVAILVAAAMADGCSQITIEQEKPSAK